MKQMDDQIRLTHYGCVHDWAMNLVGWLVSIQYGMIFLFHSINIYFILFFNNLLIDILA